MAKLTKITIDNFKALYNSIKVNIQDASEHLARILETIEDEEKRLLVFNAQVSEKSIELKSLISKIIRSHSNLKNDELKSSEKIKSEEKKLALAKKESKLVVKAQLRNSARISIEIKALKRERTKLRVVLEELYDAQKQLFLVVGELAKTKDDVRGEQAELLEVREESDGIRNATIKSIIEAEKKLQEIKDSQKDERVKIEDAHEAMNEREQNILKKEKSLNTLTARLRKVYKEQLGIDFKL